MRIRHLLTVGMMLALGLLGLRLVWLYDDAESTHRLLLLQAGAQRVSRDASGLLVLGQDYLLHQSPRASRQWHALHAELETSLRTFAGVSWQMDKESGD